MGSQWNRTPSVGLFARLGIEESVCLLPFAPLPFYASVRGLTAESRTLS